VSAWHASMLAGDARYGVAPYSTPSQHGIFVLETRAQVSCWRRACSLACAAVPRCPLVRVHRALLLRPRPASLAFCNVLIIFRLARDADR
jgi:hypothetical protein